MWIYIYIYISVCVRIHTIFYLFICGNYVCIPSSLIYGFRDLFRDSSHDS